MEFLKSIWSSGKKEDAPRHVPKASMGQVLILDERLEEPGLETMEKGKYSVTGLDQKSYILQQVGVDNPERYKRPIAYVDRHFRTEQEAVYDGGEWERGGQEGVRTEIDLGIQ